MNLKKQAGLFLLLLCVDICLGAGLFVMAGQRLRLPERRLAASGQKFETSGQQFGTSGRRLAAAKRYLAVSSAEPEPKVVALTFDDGPNAKYTETLLDGLKERGVRASFFLIGESIEGNEKIVKRMDEEGHLVGVHCLRHADLTREKLEVALKQLEETREMITGVTGKAPEYMRPPYGSWNENLSESVSMEPVFWNVDSIDWKLKNTSRIVNKVIKDTGDGDIILMHDEFATSVEAALQIIDNLQAKGYTFVTVDELSID